MSHKRVKNRIRLFVSQRILTRYREDAFYELAQDDEIELFVAFGDRKSRRFGKYSSIKETPRFPHVRMKTLSIIFERFGHVNQIFFSPSVLLHLIRFKPDVVLTEGTPNIFNNFLICSYCLLQRIPYIWWDGGIIRGQESVNIFRRILFPLILFYIKRAAVILSYSTYGKEYFKSLGIAADKIVVAGNTLRLEKQLRFKEEHFSEVEALKSEIGFQEKFIFLAVGSIEKTKRFDLLIRVFRDLGKSYPHIGLIIVGGGNAEELNRLKALAGESDRIYFAGPRFEDVGLFYSMADVFVLPGLGGLAINEAMAYALPVISAPADGTELDLVKKNRTGFLIGMDAADDLRRKMEWCIRYPEAVRKMGNHAREFVASQYSLNNMINNFKEAVRLALSAKNGGVC